MRKSGILLHIASLPNKYGIGTMGREAYKFVDWLRSVDSRNLRRNAVVEP